jgi:hypothetical protein
MQQNPDRDYYVIEARKSLLAAKEELALRKTPHSALDVQDKQQRWDTMRQLTLVRNDEERS